VKVNVRIFGAAGSSNETVVEFHGASLADLKRKLARENDALMPDDAPFVAFLNRRAVHGNWEDASLNDGDSVLLVIPVCGG